MNNDSQFAIFGIWPRTTVYLSSLFLLPYPGRPDAKEGFLCIHWHSSLEGRKGGEQEQERRRERKEEMQTGRSSGNFSPSLPIRGSPTEWDVVISAVCWCVWNMSSLGDASTAIWCSCCSKLALFESARWQRHWPFDQWPFTWLLLICRASLKFRLNRRLAAPSIRPLFGLPPASNLLHLFLSKTRPTKCATSHGEFELCRGQGDRNHISIGCHKQAKKSKFYTG